MTNNKINPGKGWQIFFLTELVLLIISLIMPVTMPYKTLSKNRLAYRFIENPSYFDEVIVYLIFVNAIVLILAVVFLIWLRLTKKQGINEKE